MDDDLPVYLTELDGELVVITENMGEPKPVLEMWCEEVRLIKFLRSCNVEPVEDWEYPSNEMIAQATVTP